MPDYSDSAGTTHQLSSWLVNRLIGLASGDSETSDSADPPNESSLEANSRIDQYFELVRDIDKLKVDDTRPFEHRAPGVSYKQFKILSRSLKGCIDDAQYLDTQRNSKISYFLDSSELISYAVPSSVSFRHFSLYGLLADIDTSDEENIVYGSSKLCFRTLFENENENYSLSFLPPHFEEVYGFVKNYESRSASQEDFNIRLFNSVVQRVSHVLQKESQENREEILLNIFRFLGEQRSRAGDQKFVQEARLFFNAYCGFSEDQLTEIEESNSSLTDAVKILNLLDQYNIKSASSRGLSADLGDKVNKKYIEENVGFGDVGKAKENVVLRDIVKEIFRRFSLIALGSRSKPKSDRTDAEALIQCIRLNMIAQQNGDQVRYRIISSSFRMMFVATAIGELIGEEWIASCVRHPLFVPEIYAIDSNGDDPKKGFHQAAVELKNHAVMIGNYVSYIERQFRRDGNINLFKNDLGELRTESANLALKVFSLLSGRLRVASPHLDRDTNVLYKSASLAEDEQEKLANIYETIIDKLSDIQFQSDATVGHLRIETNFAHVVGIHVNLFEKNNIVSEFKRKERALYLPRQRIISMSSFIQPNYSFIYFPWGHFRHIVKYTESFTRDLKRILEEAGYIKEVHATIERDGSNGVWLLESDIGRLFKKLFLASVSESPGAELSSSLDLDETVVSILAARDDMCFELDRFASRVDENSKSVDDIASEYKKIIDTYCRKSESLLWLCHILISHSNLRLVSSILSPVCSSAIRMIQSIKKSPNRNSIQNLLSVNSENSSPTEDFITVLREMLFMRHCCARGIAYDIQSERWDEEHMYAKSRRDLQYCDDLHLFSAATISGGQRSELYQFRIKCASIATFFEISLTNIVAQNKASSDRSLDFQNLNFRLEVWPIYDYIQKLKVYMEYLKNFPNSQDVAEADVERSRTTIDYLYMRTLQLYFTGMIVFSLYNNGHGVAMVWSSGETISDDDLQPFDGFENRLEEFKKLSNKLSGDLYGADAGDVGISSNSILINVVSFLKDELIPYRRTVVTEESVDTFEGLSSSAVDLLEKLTKCEEPVLQNPKKVYAFRQSGFFYSLVREVKAKLAATISEIERSRE